MKFLNATRSKVRLAGSPKKRQKNSRASPWVTAPPLPPMSGNIASIVSNRMPVVIIWAAVSAQQRGFDWSESLSLASAVAALNARSNKGEFIGIYGNVSKQRNPKFASCS
jgi:hypothetical protein